MDGQNTQVPVRQRRTHRGRTWLWCGVALTAVLAISAAVVAQLKPRAHAPAQPGPKASHVASSLVAPPVLPLLTLRPDPTGGLPKGGLGRPRVTLSGGAVRGFFPAVTAGARGDVGIVITAHPPFAGAATGGSVHEVARRVRGHNGRLRTIGVGPGMQRVLWWQESPGQWVQLDTYAGLTDNQAVQLAESLQPAALPIDAGLRLDLAPSGLALDTDTPSRLVLTSGGSIMVMCRLFGPQPLLPGTPVTVGGHRGGLQRTLDSVTLSVEVPLRGLTLVVDVPARYPISDTDLLRFGAAVHVTELAQPE